MFEIKIIHPDAPDAPKYSERFNNRNEALKHYKECKDLFPTCTIEIIQLNKASELRTVPIQIDLDPLLHEFLNAYSKQKNLDLQEFIPLLLRDIPIEHFSCLKGGDKREEKSDR